MGNLANVGGLVMLSGISWLIGSFTGRWLFRKSDVLSYKMIDSVLVGISFYFTIFTPYVIGGLIFMLAHMAWARFRKINTYSNLDVYLIILGIFVTSVGWLLISIGLKP